MSEFRYSLLVKYKIQNKKSDTRFKMPDTGYRMPETSYQLPVTSLHPPPAQIASTAFVAESSMGCSICGNKPIAMHSRAKITILA